MLYINISPTLYRYSKKKFVPFNFFHQIIFIPLFEKLDVLCYCVLWVAVCKMVSLNIWRNILTKFGAQKRIWTNRKFEPGDLDLIFMSQRSFWATACERWFPLNIWSNIWCILTTFGTQSLAKTEFKLGDLDQIFKVTKVICVRVFLLNILRNISLTKFRTGTQRGKE